MPFTRRHVAPVLVATLAVVAAAGWALGFARSDEPEKHPPTHAPAAHPATPARVSPPPTAKPAAKPEANGETKAMAKPVAKAIPGPRSAPADAGTPDASPAGKVMTEAADTVTPAQAIALLREGNQRWQTGKPTHGHCDAARREATVEHGQKPFATILTCADSRIPLERVFDQGVGDLFVIRVAGNVAGRSESGTIDYGVEHLHTPLVVVMGHTGCGAVKAACTGGHVDGNLGALLAHIAPAVERARAQNPGAAASDLQTAAIRENVWQTAFELLRQSTTLRTMARSGEVEVVGAVYDLATGKVDFLGSHPWETELLISLEGPGGAPPATANQAPGEAHAQAGDH